MIRKQVINNRETHILTGFNMTHIMKPHKNNQLTHKQFYDVSVSEPKIYVTDNIIPLNIITLVGSIILFHFYPNYYKIVKSKDPRLIPLLAVFDFIVHYTPLIYIIAYKVFNKTKINYTLCAIIFILYFVLFHSDIQKTYLDYNDYFTKAIT